MMDTQAATTWHAPTLGTGCYGDNLQVLRDSIATESVDLIYLDPPFVGLLGKAVVKYQHGDPSRTYF